MSIQEKMSEIVQLQKLKRMEEYWVYDGNPKKLKPLHGCCVVWEHNQGELVISGILRANDEIASPYIEEYSTKSKIEIAKDDLIRFISLNN